MAKRLTLDVSSMQDDFFEGAFLMGIVCAHPPTSMVWHLNDQLNTTFFRDRSMDVKLRTPRTDHVSLFPIFQMDDRTTGNRHVLYYLKAGNHRLLPELQNMDYLWLIQGADAAHDMERYRAALQLMAGVQLVQPIDGFLIQNAHHLIV